jgi:hypothetical protein
MAAENYVKIVVEAVDKASKEMDRISKAVNASLKDAEGASKGFAVGLGAAGVAIAGFGALAVKAASEAEAQMAAMDATLKAVGGSTGDVRGKIIEASQAFTKLGFDDEEAARSMALLFQRTKDVDQAMTLGRLSADLARAKNIELGEASKLVSLALSGQGRALMQYGISIKDAATPLEALEELQKAVGGQAEAFSKTFQGQTKILTQTWGNFMEVVGNEFIPVLTEMLLKLTPFIEETLPKWIEQTKVVIRFLGEHKEVLYIVAGAIIGALVPAVYAAIASFVAAAVALAPFIIGGAIIGGLVAGIMWIVKHWDLIAEKTRSVWNAITKFLSETWQGIKIIFQEGVDWIMNKLNPVFAVIDKLKSAASSVGSTVSGAYEFGKSMLGFATGGVVPGYIGQPQLALVHGGERITPAGGMSAGGSMPSVNVYVTGNTISRDTDIEDLAQRVGDAIMGRLRMGVRF